MAWNSESDLEDWMMEKLAGLGYAAASGAEISPEKRYPDGRGGILVITEDGAQIPFQVAVREKIIRFVS